MAGTKLLLVLAMTLRKKRAAASFGKEMLLGLFLFVAVIYLSYSWLIPLFNVWFGAWGAMAAALVGLVIVYFIYAFLVKQTGANPTL